MKAVIEFVKPIDADREDVASFIHDALESWGGQLRPCDPMFKSLRLTALTVGGKKFDVRGVDEDE